MLYSGRSSHCDSVTARDPPDFVGFEMMVLDSLLVMGSWNDPISEQVNSKDVRPR